MEYILSNGTKAKVDGDKVSYDNKLPKKRVIGYNHVNGVIIGGRLSAFDKTFTDEMISIGAGLTDIINTKIGDITKAYELLKNKIKDSDIDDIYKLSTIILEVVEEYFGGHENTDSRMNYYYDNDYPQSINNKISNLMGTGAAMCVERAALTQNLLRSLGIRSIYKSSGININGKNDVHSYNIVELNDKYYIFDTSMPNIIDNGISPLIGEINQEAFDLMSNPFANTGCSITTTHYNPYTSKDIIITYDSKREKSFEIQAIAEKEKHK